MKIERGSKGEWLAALATAVWQQLSLSLSVSGKPTIHKQRKFEPKYLLFEY
jgi:hypothetical protein